MKEGDVISIKIYGVTYTHMCFSTGRMSTIKNTHPERTKKVQNNAFYYNVKNFWKFEKDLSYINE